MSDLCIVGHPGVIRLTGPSASENLASSSVVPIVASYRKLVAVAKNRR